MNSAWTVLNSTNSAWTVNPCEVTVHVQKKKKKKRKKEKTQMWENAVYKRSHSFPAKQNTIYVMVKTKHKYQYDKRNPILDTTNFPIGSLVLQYPKKKAREKRPFFSLNAGPLPLSANTHTPYLNVLAFPLSHFHSKPLSLFV